MPTDIHRDSGMTGETEPTHTTATSGKMWIIVATTILAAVVLAMMFMARSPEIAAAGDAASVQARAEQNVAQSIR